MAIFKNDLYRNLGLGFMMGAIAVAITNPALAAAIL